MLASRLRQNSSGLLERTSNSAIYLIAFGHFQQLSRDDLEQLGLLGLVQDVGKLERPHALLRQCGPLSAAGQ